MKFVTLKDCLIVKNKTKIGVESPWSQNCKQAPFNNNACGL